MLYLLSKFLINESLLCGNNLFLFGHYASFSQSVSICKKKKDRAFPYCSILIYSCFYEQANDLISLDIILTVFSLTYQISNIPSLHHQNEPNYSSQYIYVCAHTFIYWKINLLVFIYLRQCDSLFIKHVAWEMSFSRSFMVLIYFTYDFP